MQDRPDLIISELSGLAFDSLQQAFRPIDIEAMMTQEPPLPRASEPIFIAIDPAAGKLYILFSITNTHCCWSYGTDKITKTCRGTTE
jgi:hypothetical protein